VDWLALTDMDTCMAPARERFLVDVRARLTGWR
jgi:hypothetical protein